MLTRMLLTLDEGRNDAMIITAGVTTRRFVHQLTQILHISLNPIRSYPISFVSSNRGNSRFSILLLPPSIACPHRKSYSVYVQVLYTEERCACV